MNFTKAHAFQSGIMYANSNIKSIVHKVQASGIVVKFFVKNID